MNNTETTKKTGGRAGGAPSRREATGAGPGRRSGQLSDRVARTTGRGMKTTTQIPPTAPPFVAGRYLTMGEAGGMAGKPAKWAEKHLQLTPGAPTTLEIPDPDDPDGTQPKTLLVREGEWIEFLESFEVTRLDRMGISRPGTGENPMPMAMMSPGQRRRVATAGRA